MKLNFLEGDSYGNALKFGEEVCAWIELKPGVHASAWNHADNKGVMEPDGVQRGFWNFRTKLSASPIAAYFARSLSPNL